MRTPLHVVRYFKGEETRLISKHLHSDAAFSMANSFIHNLREKINLKAEEPVIVAITKINEGEEQQTLMSLTNRAHGPTGEGVMISIEYTRDPAWDYSRYDRLSKSGSGQKTTADEHQGWPFTIIPQ